MQRLHLEDVFTPIQTTAFHPGLKEPP